MTSDTESRETLHDLFRSQKLAVLATGGSAHPHTSLVFFTATADLGQLVFVTSRNTRKFTNLETDGRVSVLIDNRRNLPADFAEGVAVSAAGTCRVVEGAERDRLAHLHLRQHPTLENFLAEPATAVIAVDVETYGLVSRFQDVAEFRP